MLMYFASTNSDCPDFIYLFFFKQHSILLLTRFLVSILATNIIFSWDTYLYGFKTMTITN